MEDGLDVPAFAHVERGGKQALLTGAPRLREPVGFAWFSGQSPIRGAVLRPSWRHWKASAAAMRKDCESP